MRKITESEMLLIDGGIRWKDFAEGFCDGLVIGQLVTGQVVVAALVDRGCNVFGLGTKWFS